MTVTVINADVMTALRDLPSDHFGVVVTSPPYFGLRDYAMEGQIGLEDSPDAFVARLVEVFREVRRVLRDDGTLWLNLGDSYAANRKYQVPSTKGGAKHGPGRAAGGKGSVVPEGLKPKDLIGIPWRVAFALQADGWYLRSEIIWAKPNPMPESVLDRPATAHEKVFMFTKRGRYHYDAEAVRQGMAASSVARLAQNVEAQAGYTRANGGAKTNGPMKAVGGDKQRGHGRRHAGFNERWDAMSRDEQTANGRNLRNYEPAPVQVWEIPTRGFKGAHFATFPPELVRRCLQASLRPGDAVLDPFGGSGTTGLVADKFGADATLIEINPEYCDLIRARLAAGLVRLDQPAAPMAAKAGALI